MPLMNRETIQELLQRRPFEPFTIHMTNGERFEVRHPEMAMLLKTKLIVGDPDHDRSLDLFIAAHCDRGIPPSRLNHSSLAGPWTCRK